MFTLEATILQVYLNNEPLLSYHPQQQIANANIPIIQPGNPPTTQPGVISSNNNNRAIFVKPSSLSQGKDQNYSLERFKHSIGEVSSLQIDEFVSLPPECSISIRFNSSQLAQGFFSLQKI